MRCVNSHNPIKLCCRTIKLSKTRSLILNNWVWENSILNLFSTAAHKICNLNRISLLTKYNFRRAHVKKVIRRRPDGRCCSSHVGCLWAPLEVCVPWSIDGGSKDQRRTIVMVLDGSVEQHNTLEGGGSMVQHQWWLQRKSFTSGVHSACCWFYVKFLSWLIGFNLFFGFMTESWFKVFLIGDS